jgi:hypothetical protein
MLHREKKMPLVRMHVGILMRLFQPYAKEGASTMIGCDPSFGVDESALVRQHAPGMFRILPERYLWGFDLLNLVGMIRLCRKYDVVGGLVILFHLGNAGFNARLILSTPRS